jgi:hypothetical protein
MLLETASVPQAFMYVSTRKLSPVVMIAQQVLASLLASATATTRSGFLVRSALIPVCEGAFALARHAQHRGRSCDEHFADVAITLFCDGTKLFRAATGILSGRQSEPCRKVPPRLEHARIRNAGCDNRRNQRPDAGNLIEQAAGWVFARAPWRSRPLQPRSTGRGSTDAGPGQPRPIWRLAEVPHPTVPAPAAHRFAQFPWQQQCRIRQDGRAVR